MADANRGGVLTVELAQRNRNENTRRGPRDGNGLRVRQGQKNTLEPDFENVAYGPHARNVLDIFQPDATGEPTPLVLYIHGGGFTGGDKRGLDPEVLKECFKYGFTVASTNYRFITMKPFPAPLHDGARAVQFLRSNAKKFNIDPDRFAVFGGSAGGGMAMWIAFHDDLADPNSDDPVARESTRIACAGSIGGQSTYDPRVMAEWVGEIVFTHPSMLPLYGAQSVEQMLDPVPELEAMYEECSPIAHLTQDDPPLYMLYRNEREQTLGAAVHSPVFGRKVKEKMDALGIENLLHIPGENGAGGGRSGVLRMVEFFAKHLGTAAGRDQQ